MRRYFILAVLFTFAFIASGIAVGQQGGGGKGNKGLQNLLACWAKVTYDSITLLNNPGVRSELEMTEVQAAKIPDAARKAAGEVLNAKQAKRLRQIELQQLGNNAYLEVDVKKELKITEAQAKKIKETLDLQAAGQQEISNAGGFPNIQAMQELNQLTDEAVQAALSADQKKAWTALIGTPYTVTPNIGGLGGILGGKKQ